MDSIDLERTGFTLDIDEQIATVTFAREDRGNAITVDGTMVLAEVVDELGRRDDVRVIVFTGRGRFFSAGLDIKDAARPEVTAALAAMPAGGTRRIMHEVIYECPKPTIAAVNGIAVGGGMEIATACDLRIAASGASFGLPEAKRGMGAIFGATVLPRIIPRALALELLYTGEPIDADTALQWGLVNRVVGPDDFDAATGELARRIAANAPVTLRRIKALATTGSSLPIASAMRLDIGPNPYTSGDRLEGLQAWREGREANWTGS